jgi:hypothetical protein
MLFMDRGLVTAKFLLAFDRSRIGFRGAVQVLRRRAQRKVAALVTQACGFSGSSEDEAVSAWDA